MQELKLYPHQKVAIDALRELPDEASVYKRDFTKTEMRIVDSILSEEARQRLYKSLLVSKHKSAIIGHPQTLRLLKEAVFIQNAREPFFRDYETLLNWRNSLPEGTRYKKGSF